MSADALGQSEPIWVGLLDLDRDEAVTQISGPVRPDHSLARVLVRMHGAPIGYVHVPIRPASTLTARARSSAREWLADALTRHGQLDSADLLALVLTAVGVDTAAGHAAGPDTRYASRPGSAR